MLKEGMHGVVITKNSCISDREGFQQLIPIGAPEGWPQLADRDDGSGHLVEPLVIDPADRGEH